MPGTQPAWYAGTGVFLTLPCMLSGCDVWGSRWHRGLAGGWDRKGRMRRAAYGFFPSRSCPSEAVTLRYLLEGLPDPRRPVLPTHSVLGVAGGLRRGGGGPPGGHVSLTRESDGADLLNL